MERLSGNITRLYIFSFLQMTLFPMAIITIFWKEHIGLSLFQILLLQSVFSLASVLLEYPSGYICDRVGYRASLSFASLLGVAGWALYTIADSFGDVLLAEILLGVSLSFISGSDSALLYETLKAQGKEAFYSRFEGRMTGFSQSGEALGAVFAGVLYAASPLSPFVLQVAVWIAALAVTRTLVESPRKAPLRPVSHLSEAAGIARYVFWENAHLRSTIVFNTLLGLASFFPVWLVQPYMRQTGVPLGWFGPIWAGANITVALCALASHRSHRLLGDRGMAALFLGLVVTGYLGLGIVGGVWGFLFYYLLTCMRGLRGPMMLKHVQEETASGSRASVLSLQSLTFRLSFACVAPFVGKLTDVVGVQMTFYYLMFAFMLLTPFLATMFLKNVRKKVRVATE